MRRGATRSHREVICGSAGRAVARSWKGITKSFPGVVALQDARAASRARRSSRPVGQNGAGKSTLIKILTGAYRRDGGTIMFDGRPVDFHSPQQAQVQGVSTIYQEVNLVPFRSVSENIFMGREPRRWGLIDWRRMNREAAAILARFGIHVDVTQPLMTLNVAVQQMVAIARAVSVQSKLVVMDEPTSSLDEQRGRDALRPSFASLRPTGSPVIFVSHRLDEILRRLRPRHDHARRADGRRAAGSRRSRSSNWWRGCSAKT